MVSNAACRQRVQCRESHHKRLVDGLKLLEDIENLFVELWVRFLQRRLAVSVTRRWSAAVWRTAILCNFHRPVGESSILLSASMANGSGHEHRYRSFERRVRERCERVRQCTLIQARVIFEVPLIVAFHCKISKCASFTQRCSGCALCSIGCLAGSILRQVKPLSSSFSCSKLSY
jgi:hypothetical protein